MIRARLSCTLRLPSIENSIGSSSWCIGARDVCHRTPKSGVYNSLMRMLRFGRTNVEVPAVSVGTWGHGGPRVARETSVGWSGNDDAAASAALARAFDAGLTHWDTADVYGDGHAERLIGAMWTAVPREKIFLATKKSDGIPATILTTTSLIRSAGRWKRRSGISGPNASIFTTFTTAT